MINDGKEYDHLQPEIIRVMQRQFLHPIRSSRDERIMLRETAGCFHLALEKDRLRGQMEAGAKKHSIEETCKKHLCEETHINMMKEELQKERQRIIRERERGFSQRVRSNDGDEECLSSRRRSRWGKKEKPSTKNSGFNV